MYLDGDYISSFYIDNYTYYFYDSEISLETNPTSVLPSVVCNIVIFCISVLGNIFLLCVLLKERAWRTTSDILLLQLILSDLCLTATLPFSVYDLLHDWILGDWICGIVIATSSLGFHSYVLILTAMILFSYVAEVHTSCLSARARPKFCVLMTSIFLWLACAAGSLRVSANAEVVDGFDSVICVHAPQKFTLLYFTYMEIAIFFLIPAIIITFCCVHMWVTIKNCRTNRHQQVFRLNLGIITVFFLCLVPYNIILLIESLTLTDVLRDITELRSFMNLFAQFVMSTLPCFHCCLNPLLHIFGAQRFRRHLPVPCKTSQRGDGSQNPVIESVR